VIIGAAIIVLANAVTAALTGQDITAPGSMGGFAPPPRARWA
jgi:hypothetical protein